MRSRAVALNGNQRSDFSHALFPPIKGNAIKRFVSESQLKVTGWGATVISHRNYGKHGVHGIHWHGSHGVHGSHGSHGSHGVHFF